MNNIKHPPFRPPVLRRYHSSFECLRHSNHVFYAKTIHPQYHFACDQHNLVLGHDANHNIPFSTYVTL